MMTYEKTLAALLADPLSAARTAAQSGRRVIAYVGADIPVELILAADAVPVRLSGRIDRPTPHADGFVERAFHPEVRSIAEAWVCGELDFIDAVILARSDDSGQRLYYYICELQRRGACRGPRPLIYDIAAISRSSSTFHTAAATERLAQEIGAREDQLAPAAKQVDELTQLLKYLSGLQSAATPLRGSAAVRMARALQYNWAAEFRTESREHLNSAAIQSAPARRVLFAGNAPPNEAIHGALESSGASIVRELTDAKWFPYPGPAEPIARSFDEVGARIHGRATLSQLLARSRDTLAQQAQLARADGVLIWMIEEDNTLGWELPDQLRALEQARVPVLSLTRQNWVPDPQALASMGAQSAQFAVSIRSAP